MKKIEQYAPVGLAVLASVCAVLVSIVLVLEFWTYNDAFFTQQYQSYGAAQTIGVTEETLREVTDVLQDYLAGKRDNLDCVTERAGAQQEFFNQREKDHMDDVVLLFDFARLVKKNGLLLMALALLGLWGLRREQKDALRIASRGYMRTMGVVLALALVALALIVPNFDAAWRFLHTVVFSNDLWVLDPATDMLINLVPLPFFMGISARIGLCLAAVLAALGAAAACVLALGRHKDKKGESSEL